MSMAARIGIELSPTACRIVEIDAGLSWRKNAHETRVMSFTVLPPSGPDTQAKLESLRGHRAAVVVWDGSSDHRQVMVTRGSYETMRAEALGALEAAGVTTRGVWADIAPVTEPGDRGTRRPVVVALSSAAALRSALEPLQNAGIRLRSVMTPAVALDSLARLRRAFTVPGSMEAYVALEETVTAVALVRDGALLAARVLEWGYLDGNLEGRPPRHFEDIAKRLADELSEFFADLGGSPGSLGGVRQVCLCGGLSELRTMTARLMEHLDVEVETLDSLFGIDANRLPDPGDEFRERSTEMRIAWAAAADWPPPINLLRARRRQASKTALRRLAVAAGVVAGLSVGWAVSRVTDTKAVKRVVSKAPALLARATPPSIVTKPLVATKPPVVTPPSSPVTTKPPVVAAKPMVMTKPSLAATKPTVVTKPTVTPPPPPVATKPIVPAPAPPISTKPSVVATKPAVVTKPPTVASPPLQVATKPIATAPPSLIAASRPPIQPPPIVPRSAEPAPQPTPPAAERRSVEPPPLVMPPAPSRVTTSTAVARSEPPAGPATRARSVPESALPFDAVLGTILYSPDRRLAIIDGHIVGLGDEVRGARIVDITPGAVSLRDAQGKLRRLTLGAGGR